MATAINAGNGGLTILLQADPLPNDQADAVNHEATLSAVGQWNPLIGEDFPDEAYGVIATVLKAQQNFDLTSYKVVNMKRRLAAYLRSCGCTDPLHYSAQLTDRADEQKQLIAAMGIHVSHFFRNPSTFLALESRILPELLRMSRRQNSKLRIWSVGCAHGEEPYSVALLLKEMLQKGDQFAVVGTDLSPEALKMAKNGYYPPDRLKEVPPTMLEKYFSAQSPLYQIHEDIRQLVQFFRHDIISEEIFYRADLILCRNLLIYFAREKQQQVVELLAGALSPGGYLVLGRAETLAPDCRRLFFCVDPAERIYRRIVDL